MNDPYQVLGVAPSVSDDELKRAYRELAKKYHPDNYANNPLSDLAQEKMKEINEAYDTILKARAAGTRAAGSGGFGYQEIRSLIATGNLAKAEQLLNQMPNQDAEWHFLMGSLALRKGWYDEARQQFQIASQMEPGNPEYRAALNRLVTAQTGTYQQYQGGVCPQFGVCECCSTMVCMDLCCNC